MVIAHTKVLDQIFSFYICLKMCNSNVNNKANAQAMVKIYRLVCEMA
jgi:hypothetical protein